MVKNKSFRDYLKGKIPDLEDYIWAGLSIPLITLGRDIAISQSNLEKLTIGISAGLFYAYPLLRRFIDYIGDNLRQNEFEFKPMKNG